jgi:cell division cycle 14
MENTKSKHSEHDMVLTCMPDKRCVTNAVFLLGAYMIMTLSSTPDNVARRFRCVDPWLLSFRDVSPGKQNFRLQLSDCWEGLYRAKKLSWVSFSTEPGCHFELSDYEHCDNPLNADLHEVVPGKFIAMRGPISFEGGLTYEDTPSGVRNFSPAHYGDILRQYDVQVVVRLNEAHYEEVEWVQEGLALADLPFDDCAPPPAAVVAKFLAIAEGVPGALAVHCKAGLGRTGTLIALYMMKHHGFTARQAMGWLRIVRPGSVIGSQQQFLCESERAIQAAGEAFRRRGGPGARLCDGATLAATGRFIAAACAAADARASKLQLGHLCASKSLPRCRCAFSARPGCAWCCCKETDTRDMQGALLIDLAAHVSAAADSRSLRRSRSEEALASMSEVPA